MEGFLLGLLAILCCVQTTADTVEENIARACTVYCYGDILAAVQLSGIYNDSKTFVDMPMKQDPEVVNQAFLAIDASDTAALQQFLDTYFYPYGSDINEWTPPDLQEEPAFLASIEDDGLRQWGSELNQLWNVLGREVDASVAENPQRHSFVPRNYPMIVPGGRFRESYYWDTWWIVRGLLVCDMTVTAEYVINNLLDDIENFGFVPNGGRIYYLDRSQPPLLSEMVNSYVDKLGVGSKNATRMLTRAFPLLLIEYDWWMDSNNGHVVAVQGSGGETYTLNRYSSNASSPRPESYAEDVGTAAEAGAGRSSADLYHNIRSAAESGWDFSSRWIAGSKPKNNISNIETLDIIPVDLNCYMYRWELNMAEFARILGQSSTVRSTYLDAAADRAAAIDAVLWRSHSGENNLQGLWYDYNITAGASQKNNGDSSLSLAQWIPMWAGLAVGKSVESLLSTLFQSGIIQDGGLLTTLATETGQQWDSPNAWAPLVLLTVEGLSTVGIPAATFLASNISKSWISTNYIAFERSGYMYEKYNAYEVGVGGGGGEYKPQIGFGWSNGVALVLLNSTILLPPDQSGSDADEQISILMIVMISICGSLVCCGLLFFITFRCFRIHAPNKTISDVVGDIISPQKRGRKDSYNPEGPPRPSNEIASRSGRTGTTRDSGTGFGSDSLLARMVVSDDMSEQSAAYF